MPTVVRNLDDDQRYLLVGTGFGLSESATPHWLFGKLGFQSRTSRQAVVCMCDDQGQLCWADSDRVIVEHVDGVTPSDALAR